MLGRTVTSLRQELDQLRAGMRHRAVIEQAKGILMQRHGIAAERAFEQMRSASRESNRRLVEVAADEVHRVQRVTPGTSATAPTGSLPGRAELPREPGAGPDRRRQLLLVGPALAHTHALRDAASVLAAYCPTTAPPERVAVYVADRGGDVHLVSHAGLDGATVARWRRLRGGSRLPVVESLEQARPVFSGEAEDVVDRWPDLAAAGYDDTFVVLPLPGDDPQLLVAAAWPLGGVLTNDERRHLREWADLVRPRLRELAHAALPDGQPAAGPGPGTVQTVLDAFDQPAAWLVDLAGPGPDGSVAVEPVLAHLNDAAAAHADAYRQVGRRLSEVAPDLVGTALWHEVERHLHAVVPPVTVPVAASPFGGPEGCARVVSLWDGVLLVLTDR